MATVFYEHASAELATLTNTFSVSGVATDPTTITLTVTDPAGTATSYTHAGGTITRTSAGVYTKDIPCTMDGIWTYTWIGTGAASDVVAGTWTVFGTELSKLYCSVEELKSRLGITDTQDDFELRLAVDTASRWIDEHCARHFWRASQTRTYIASNWYCLEVDDLVSVTTLKTDPAGDGTFETTWASTDYQLLPLNAASGAEARPYTELKVLASNTFPVGYGGPIRADRVELAAVFGWPAIPAAIKDACLMLAAEGLKMKDAPFGVAGFGEFGAVRVRVNPLVLARLAPYRKYPVLVA
jgi:hypothetical protein